MFLSPEFKDAAFGCDRAIGLQGPAALSLAENPEQQQQFYRWLQTCGTNKEEKATRAEQEVIWDAWDQVYAPRRYYLSSVSQVPPQGKITPFYFTGAVVLNIEEAPQYCKVGAASTVLMTYFTSL